MLAMDPVTLTGNPQTITLPLNLPQSTTLLFGNESAYAISVRIGGYQKWIHAWTADIVPIPQGANTVISLTPVLVGSSVNAPSATVLLSLADPGETIPGTYPINLDRLTSLAGGNIQLTNSSVTISNSPNVSVVNTPTVVANAGSGTMATTVTNTPAVTVSGTPNVAVTNTPAVSVSGTPNVAVTNSPAVTVSGTPNVAVTNSPTVVANAGTGTMAVSASNLGVTNASGTQLQTIASQTSLGTVSLAQNLTASLAGPYTVPVGTHGIAVIIEGAQNRVFQCQIIGVQSGLLYANIVPSFSISNSNPFYVPWVSAVDTQVKFLIDTNPFAGTVKLDFVAILDTAVVAVASASGVFPVQLTDVAGDYLTFDSYNTVRSLYVSNLNANAAPWQAAWSTYTYNLPPLAAAGTFTLVAGVSLKRIYVHRITVSLGENSGGGTFNTFLVRQSSSANYGLGTFFAGCSGNQQLKQWTHDARGAPTAVGDGLVFGNVDSVSHTGVCSVSFSQAP